MTTIQAVDYTAPDAARLFTESLRNTGFGVLKNHPIDKDRVTAIYDHWADFFADNAKESFLFNPETHDGFFPTRLAEAAKGQDIRDLKEYFHYYPWGRCPDQLKQEVHAYYEDTVAFAKKLLSWIEEHTADDIRSEFSEPLMNMVTDSTQSLLRILHYPPIEGEAAKNLQAGAIRAAAHEDINLITILPAANEPGLQVLSRDGNWIDVPCQHGYLIINNGDMLQEATDGYYPSTTHRVINPATADVGRARLSIPLFLHPRPEVVLSRRYTAGSYLNERLQELRQAKN